MPSPDGGESVMLLEDQDGLPVLPAFTSEDALRRWNPEGSPYVGLKGRALVEMLAGSDWDRIVFDPADPEPMAITRSAAREMLGIVADALPAGTTFAIGEPARTPPNGLVQNVWQACEAEAAVDEAFLYQLAIVGREPAQLTIGLRLTPGVDESEKERIAQAIGGAADPQSWGYEFVGLQILDGDLLDTVRSEGSAIFLRHPASA